MKKTLLVLFLLSARAFGQGACGGGTYNGSVMAGEVLNLNFNCAVAGAPTTLGTMPAVKWYKDGGTTEATTGLTVTYDFDMVTGLNNVAVDTTSLAAGNYTLVVTAGAVGAVSPIGNVVGSFSVGMPREANIRSVNANTANTGSTAGKLDLVQLTVTPAVDTAAITLTPSGTGKAISALGQIYVAPTNTDDDALKLVPNGTGLPLVGASTFPKGKAVAKFPVWALSPGGAPVSGVTPACTIAKDGGAASAVIATASASDAKGESWIALTATETDAKTFNIVCTAVGAATFRSSTVTQR